MNNVKLGIFVLAGLLFLIVLLYMIGNDQNMFGSTIPVKARFANVQGLVAGNNVRYAGIEVGTVKRITILNDTLIEVHMVVDSKMKQFIRSNALAAIGTDGLMGNKVINIVPGHGQAPFLKPGDVLAVRKTIHTDEIFRTLDQTSSDVAIIAGNLKATVMRINSSTALWELLNDNSLPRNIRASAANVQAATARASKMTGDLQEIVSGIKHGKGSLGTIINDTALAANLNDALLKIKAVGERADELAATLNAIAVDVRREINTGNGPANALLRDSAMVMKLNTSLTSIQTGTEAFSQNMEALKHNIFFRGYFRKLEKQKKKNVNREVASQ
jgi:phospholipid/cholesterol/gamma-HCH transport system substrate-binding protein